MGGVCKRRHLLANVSVVCGAHERWVWDNLLQTIVDSGILTAVLSLRVLRWLLNLRSINDLVLAVLVDLLVQEMVPVLFNLRVCNGVL